MTCGLDAVDLALARSLPPWRDLVDAGLADAGVTGVEVVGAGASDPDRVATGIPPDLDYGFRHEMRAWCGRTLVIDHHWRHGCHDAAFGGPANPYSLTVRTTFTGYLRWRRGDITTLELLAASEPFTLTGRWTELLTAHGLVQLGLVPALRAVTPPDAPTIEWAEAVASAPPAMSLDEVLELWPAPGRAR